jgi:hypothetical protein
MKTFGVVLLCFSHTAMNMATKFLHKNDNLPQVLSLRSNGECVSNKTGALVPANKNTVYGSNLPRTMSERESVM